MEPTAYLYHDANTPADAHPWLHSTMLVLAADRRPGLRGESPLYTQAQLDAAVAAAYAKCAQICRDEADEWERVFAETAENCAEKIDNLTPPAA